MLARTRGDFDPIYRALVAKGVPVEVDTLGGFWTRPEILDVVAWLRVLDDPGDNLALGRLLLGPAYRLGLRDLFFLADRAKNENYRMRRGDLDLLPYRLADSIVAQEEIPELSDDARERITRFHTTWRELAGVATRVTLADLVGEIARISGLAAELAASPNPEAELALRHLAKLRDIAQGYQPVAGSLDLGGFVDYLDSLDEADQDEDELRATEENAVRLLTLHRAKGLEWDVVFLPSLVKGHMPHPGKGANNPEERWERLPFELRGDRQFLPPPPTTKEQLDQLRDEEERRLMYVGLTRARRRLVLSRSWYYRDNVGSKEPSPFWEEALATGLVAAQTDGVSSREPVPRRHRSAARPRNAIRTATDRPGRSRAARGGAGATPRGGGEAAPGVAVACAVDAFGHGVPDLRARSGRVLPPLRPTSALAALPSREAGTELHRRIELHARGVAAVGGPAEDLEEPYDLDPGERKGGAEPVSAEQMWKNFQQSRFAQMKPLMVEQPFTLYIGEGISIQGRIDAVFEREDGVWEVIDYKTGKSDPDPLQLAIYSRAIEEIWGRRTQTSWLLLRTGEEQAAPAVEDLSQVLTQVSRCTQGAVSRISRMHLRLARAADRRAQP